MNERRLETSVILDIMVRPWRQISTTMRNADDFDTALPRRIGTLDSGLRVPYAGSTITV